MAYTRTFSLDTRPPLRLVSALDTLYIWALGWSLYILGADEYWRIFTVVSSLHGNGLCFCLLVDFYEECMYISWLANRSVPYTIDQPTRWSMVYCLPRPSGSTIVELTPRVAIANASICVCSAEVGRSIAIHLVIVTALGGIASWSLNPLWLALIKQAPDRGVDELLAKECSSSAASSRTNRVT